MGLKEFTLALLEEIPQGWLTAPYGNAFPKHDPKGSYPAPACAESGLGGQSKAHAAAPLTAWEDDRLRVNMQGLPTGLFFLQQFLYRSLNLLVLTG